MSVLPNRDVFKSLRLNDRIDVSDKIMRSHLDFARFFFPIVEGTPFIVGHHHKIISHTLDEVFKGNIKRLVINIPAGYTKTELAVINFIARGFALNPRCRFLHVSANDRLVGDNSSKAKDIIKNDIYQMMYPTLVRSDTSGKHHWRTSGGGEVLAVSAAGSVIGFRAGRPDHSDTNFTGAILIDDPIKPMDAYSPAMRNTINATINNAVMSRLMLENVPVIMIMQRVHEHDPTNYVLTGGTGEKWHHLCMPAYNKYGHQPPTPNNYTHAIPVEYDVPVGALWPFKHTVEQLEQKKNAQSEEGESTGLYVFNAQYQQKPAAAEDGMFKLGWLRSYEKVHESLHNIKIYVDAAEATGLTNDWSVLMLAGRILIRDEITQRVIPKVVILDVIRKRWKINDLVKNTKAFWEKHHTYRDGFEIRKGAERILIENASNGTALIQILEDDEDSNYHITTVNRSESKVVRAATSVEYVQRGQLLIPEVPNTFTTCEWVTEFKNEFKMFNEMDTHPYDDQLDCMFDAVEDQLIGYTVGNHQIQQEAPMGGA